MMRSNIVAGASLVAALFTARSAFAEPSGSEKAAAEALFQEGSALIESEKIAEACPKFEASQQLDPALGTMLRLADCWDRVGKTASAWALFQEAASTARVRSQPDRERIATERANDLAKRLSKLAIKVEQSKQPSNLEVRLNGIVIPRATWNSAIPVDPGRQQLEVSAPNYHSWSSALDVPKGPVTKAISVPALAPKPEEPERSVAVTPTTSNEVTYNPKRGSVQRTFGYVTAGLGLLGLGTGGFLSYRAYDLNRKSLDECRSEAPNACTGAGVDIRDNAQAHATGATVAFGIGAGLLATGVVLIATAPKAEQKPGVRVSRLAIRNGSRISLEGTW